MDAETRTLLYAVALGAGVGLFSIVRRRAHGSLRFHAGVLAALLTASLVAVLAPDAGEWLATPVLIAFLTLAVAPSLLLTVGRQFARARRFSAAHAASFAGAALLGLPGLLRSESRLYGALAASDRGEIERARALLRRLCDDGGIPPGIGGRTLAEALPLAGARRWADVVSVLDGAPSRATAVLAVEARAAAETGDLGRALRACAVLDGRGESPAARETARRAVLAAAGRLDVLTTAARERWPLMGGPRGARALVLGRAHEASGDVEGARHHYETALRRAPPAVRGDAREGLARLVAGRPRRAPHGAQLGEVAAGLDALERRCRAAAARAAARRGSRPIATWLLSAVTALVSAVVLVSAGADGFALLARGALSAPLVANEGQWWRLFTAMLLHGGWWHLILNLGAIVPVGVIVERRLGASRTLIVYLAAGLCGSLASVYLNGTPIGVGASGAAMGLIGALLVLLRRRSASFGAVERRRWSSMLWMGVFATAAIGLLEHEYFDNAAHGAGLLGGMLVALFVLPVRDGRTESALRRVGTRLCAALLTALLVAATVQAVRDVPEWTSLRVVRARGAAARLPGWLRTRPVRGGGIVAARPPAEIAVLIGALPDVAPDPLLLVPAEGALHDLVAKADPAQWLAGPLHPAPGEIDDLPPEWHEGVRFVLLRRGAAFALVRLPAGAPDPVYDALLAELRGTLRPVAAQSYGDDAENE